jgi:hypothetical protein
MRRLAIITTVVLSLLACAKTETAPEAAKPANTNTTATTASVEEVATPSGQVMGEPCSMFTVADATAAFGQPMQAGQQSNNSCEIMSVDRAANAVTLNYRISDSPVMYAAMSASGTQVTGLGEKALWVPNAKQLIVLKGGRELQLAIIGTSYVDDAKVRPKAEEIAKKIVAQM